MRYLTLAFVISVIIYGCEFKNEEDFEKQTCDTINVTYSRVKPVFSNNCVRCHNDQLNYFGIKLNSYENAKNAAQTGLLKLAVSHDPQVTPMPFQLPKLDDCDLRKVIIWIDTGTPN
jgi:hypothetical protein